MSTTTAEMATSTRRRRVSYQLEQELSARGVAQAIVFLAPPLGTVGAGAPEGAVAATAALSATAAAVGPGIADLATCFVKDDRSISASLSNFAAEASLSMRPRARRGGGAAAMSAAARSYEARPAMRTFPSLGIVLGDVHNDGLERLAVDPRVQYVASSLVLSLIRPVTGAAASLAANTTTWGIEKLQIPALWAAGVRGNGVRIGHLDTGVDATHPSLVNAVGGYLLTDFDGFAVEGARPQDTGEHGTHTAGTIAGRPVNGRNIGVAPAAELHSATVIEGGNVVARILAGMDWAVSQGVKVISMSLGLRGLHDDFRALLTAVRSRGVLPVIAVGNEGPGTSRSPGNYDIVLSVGASTEIDTVADFSSSEWFSRPGDPLVPDLVAPGDDVISARAGGGFLSLSGTSMATPHIAGLAALLWEAKPTATVNMIESAILNSCALGTMPHPRANRGLPNGPRAFELLTGAPPVVGRPPQAPARRAPARRKRPKRLPARKKKAAKKVVGKKVARRKK
jgi:subtilisin